MELGGINYPSMTLVMPAFFEAGGYSGQCRLVMSEMKNINFGSDRARSMSGEIQAKQFLAIFRGFGRPSGAYSWLRGIWG